MESALAAELRDHFMQAEAAAVDGVPASGDLHRLYQARAYAPLWLDVEGRPNAAAHEALELLRGAAAEGLNPADYPSDLLAEQLARLHASGDAAPSELVNLDLGLSQAVLSYLQHLHLGRVDPASLGFRIADKGERPDFAAHLQSALETQRLSGLVETLAPRIPQYRKLREQLSRYRSLMKQIPSTPLPSGAMVQPGDPYAAAAALHRRLVGLGDLPADTPRPSAGLYAGALVEGVRRFQSRHGLQPDGILGRSTWQALNVPLASRVRQIELSLERLRWLPLPDKGPFLAVNVPMYRLSAWEGSPLQAPPSWRMDVIVGRAMDTQTPLFKEDMRYLVFSPYWNIPRSIVRDEILPALQQDPNHLRRQGMELVQGGAHRATVVAATPGNIERLRQGRLWVRQRPGPRNALGPAKFIFPNDEAVYLHGTSRPGLFQRMRRDLSHGCVRVEDPAALAAWLLSKQPGDWSRERIEAAMRSSRPQRVDLAQPVPVLLYYLTAEVQPEDGRIHFARDIYGHDRKLAQALERARTL